jgi:dynein heavy chain, axonemal
VSRWSQGLRHQIPTNSVRSSFALHWCSGWSWSAATCLVSGLDFEGLSKYLVDSLPAECPQLFGLHPNSEIGYLTSYCDSLMQSILMLNATKAASSPALVRGATRRLGKLEDTDVSPESTSLMSLVQSLASRLPNELSVADAQVWIVLSFYGTVGCGILTREYVCVWQALAESMRSQEHAPYFAVLVQESARMNRLLYEIRRSLLELTRGLDGQLNLTDAMSDLAAALLNQEVRVLFEPVVQHSVMAL